MIHRRLLAVFLWVALASGALAIPAAIVISAEDGPMPADQVFRKKALARTVLLIGGGIAASATCGLYAIGRRHRALKPNVFPEKS
jgi:hypothetical protein